MCGFACNFGSVKAPSRQTLWRGGATTRLIKPDAYSSTHCQRDALSSSQIPLLLIHRYTHAHAHIEALTVGHELGLRRFRSKVFTRVQTLLPKDSPKTPQRTQEGAEEDGCSCAFKSWRIPVLICGDLRTRGALHGTMTAAWSIWRRDHLYAERTTQPDYAASSGHGSALLSSGGPPRPQDTPLQEFHDRGDPHRPPGAQSLSSGRGAAQIRGPRSSVGSTLPQPAG